MPRRAPPLPPLLALTASLALAAAPCRATGARHAPTSPPPSATVTATIERPTAPPQPALVDEGPDRARAELRQAGGKAQPAPAASALDRPRPAWAPRPPACPRPPRTRLHVLFCTWLT